MYAPLYAVSGKQFYYAEHCHWDPVSAVMIGTDGSIFTIYKAAETGEYSLQAGVHGQVFTTFPTHGRYFKTVEAAQIAATK